jgi:hypothetical protein
MSTVGSAFNHQFPPRDMLWPGCLLASIAHAVFVARSPLLAHEQSWSGRTYNIQDSEGSRGTIAFGDDSTLFVAVSYLQTGQAGFPIDPTAAEACTRTLLQGVPKALERLSSEALQFVLEDVGGEPTPVITAAFWSDLNSSQVTACESWPDVVNHGAVMFLRQFADPNTALAMWAAECAFDSSEITLVRAVFNRRLSTSGSILLAEAEVRQIHQRSVNNKGLEACRESFGEIGIVLP